MRSNQQVRVFQTLLREPRFAAVLQFYAGFTKLTNEGVRNIITGSDFTNTPMIYSTRQHCQAQLKLVANYIYSSFSLSLCSCNK